MLAWLRDLFDSAPAPRAHAWSRWCRANATTQTRVCDRCGLLESAALRAELFAPLPGCVEPTEDNGRS
jgi:hypothetical protein